MVFLIKIKLKIVWLHSTMAVQDHALGFSKRTVIIRCLHILLPKQNKKNKKMSHIISDKTSVATWQYKYQWYV